MIRRLQAKLVAIVMAVLLAVFAVVLVTLNVFMHVNSTRQIDTLLETVASQDGIPFLFPDEGRGMPRDIAPRPFYGPAPRRMWPGRFFYVKTDPEGGVIEAEYDMIYSMAEVDAKAYASQALAKVRNRGSIDHYQYLIQEKDYGYIIVFAERGVEIQMLSDLIYFSLAVAAASSAVLFVFAVLLSRWAIQPVKITLDKQRRFVSDASHELKTPLTIIATNADVLENEIGENRRLNQIRAQSARMSRLIHDMLALAKTDEAESAPPAAPFDLSAATLNTVLEFESSAFEEGKTLEYDIRPGCRMTGNAEQIKQVVSILVDNAIKHSSPAGSIRVKLWQEGGKRYLSVYNTGEGVRDADRDRIFERFYRSDESRSRETGGYGLGLAIAKSIVDLHRGRIQLSGRAGEWVCFTVIL